MTFHGFQDPDPRAKGEEGEGNVRWSGGTEIGEFMRDAAKIHSFKIMLHLSQRDWDIEVTVPNFEGIPSKTMH